MNIKTRKYGDFFEVQIKFGDVTFDSGFLDVEEAQAMRDTFIRLVEDLDWYVNTQKVDTP